MPLQGWAGVAMSPMSQLCRLPGLFANQSLLLATNATDARIGFAGGATFASLVGQEVVLEVCMRHASTQPCPFTLGTRPPKPHPHPHPHPRPKPNQVRMRQASLFSVGFAPEGTAPERKGP